MNKGVSRGWTVGIIRNTEIVCGPYIPQRLRNVLEKRLLRAETYRRQNWMWLLGVLDTATMTECLSHHAVVLGYSATCGL